MKKRSMALYYKRSKVPGPKGRLGPIVVNRHGYVTCIVSQERRDRAGHLYESASGLCKSAGRQPVYIRGRPGGGSGTRNNKSIARHSLFSSLVSETPIIPSQLDVGLYLHRGGRTSIKSLVSFVRFNPFKQTRRDGSTTKSLHEDI